MKATEVEIQPGKVKRETLTVTVSAIVQYPLSQTPDRGDPARAIRDRVSVIGVDEPEVESIPAQRDGLSQLAARLADEGAERGQQFDVADQIGQLSGSVLQQILR